MNQRGALLLTSVVSLVACRAPAPSANQPDDSMTPKENQPIVILVMSGRPQPPPQDFAVRIGAAVTLRVVGLGPARAAVFGPNGARVTTVETPVLGEGGVIGTEHRFTAGAAGDYRVEHAEQAGLVLARLHAS
jgi:hypothetical protein